MFDNIEAINHILAVYGVNFTSFVKAYVAISWVDLSWRTSSGICVEKFLSINPSSKPLLAADEVDTTQHAGAGFKVVERTSGLASR